MPDSDSLRQECIARTTDDHRIGVDATGAAHYYSTYLGVVWTVVDDDIEHIEQTRDLGKWRRFIRARRGWSHHTIGEDTRASDEANALARCA